MIQFNRMQSTLIIDGVLLMIVAWIAKQLVVELPYMSIGVWGFTLFYIGIAIPVLLHDGKILFWRWLPHSFLVRRCDVCSGNGYRVKIENPSSLKYRSYVNRPCEHCKARGWNWRWTL